MRQEEIEDIIERYFKGMTSPQEDQLLSRWYDQFSLDDSDPSDMRKQDINFLKESMLQKLLKDARKTVEQHNSVRSFMNDISWKGWALVAACFILFYFSLVVYRLQYFKNADNQYVMKIKTLGIPGQNIPGGHNGALLHLSNGRTIYLDSLHNGMVAEQNGVKILKDENGLVYVGQAKETIFNDITTARGQQWSITLPDGTKVKLNAESSIHYPLTFNGKERVVAITGEAYFEVVHNEKQPFIVQAGKTRIEDIGTAFNIYAYSDEPIIKTTLLRGSVKVTAGKTSRVLIPGQQAETDASHLVNVRDVDTDNAIGWTNGEMIFDDEELAEVLKRISRWYDIDIFFEGKIPKRKFAGSISRKLNLSEFLKLLAFENVSYKLNDRNLTILP